MTARGTTMTTRGACMVPIAIGAMAQLVVLVVTRLTARLMGAMARAVAGLVPRVRVRAMTGLAMRTAVAGLMTIAARILLLVAALGLIKSRFEMKDTLTHRLHIGKVLRRRVVARWLGLLELPVDGVISPGVLRGIRGVHAIRRMYYLPAIAAVANQSACPYSIRSSNAYLVIETLQPPGHDDGVEPSPKQLGYALR